MIVDIVDGIQHMDSGSHHQNAAHIFGALSSLPTTGGRVVPCASGPNIFKEEGNQGLKPILDFDRSPRTFASINVRSKRTTRTKRTRGTRSLLFTSLECFDAFMNNVLDEEGKEGRTISPSYAPAVFRCVRTRNCCVYVVQGRHTPIKTPFTVSCHHSVSPAM